MIMKVPGEMESEIVEAGDASIFLRNFYARCNNPAPLFLPKGEAFKDMPSYPKWLSNEDVSYYNNKFTQSGFTGGLNYYRALNLYVSLSHKLTYFTKTFTTISLDFTILA